MKNIPGGITPKMHYATLALLERSTSLGIDTYEAMEAYVRCLISVALDAGHGDNKRAAEWIDKWLLPNITHFRDHLAKGGTTPAAVIKGERLQS